MADDHKHYPAAFWKERADKARAKINDMVSEDGRRWMREVAHLYDSLAEKAAELDGMKEGGKVYCDATDPIPTLPGEDLEELDDKIEASPGPGYTTH